MNKEELINEINKLKKERNALIIAHNYQRAEIQQVADFVGESYELGVRAREATEDVIVCCAVSFMAEMVHILNPTKVVILPNSQARCPMADMITEEEVLRLKNKYKGYRFVAYMNTNANVKRHMDACCTASNAIRVIKNIESNKIVFLPDKNLVCYINKEVNGKEIVAWNGCCRVHDNVTVDDILKEKEKHPDAVTLVHPECSEQVANIADKILGTGEIIEYVKKSKHKEFLIGTEEGMLHRLAQEAPHKTCYLASKKFVCPNMKRITLLDVYNSLRENKNTILLNEQVRRECEHSFNEMFRLSEL